MTMSQPLGLMLESFPNALVYGEKPHHGNNPAAFFPIGRVDNQIMACSERDGLAGRLRRAIPRLV